MTRKEIKPPRLHPPSRWDELSTGFGEEHPIDILIRNSVTPWPSESRTTGLQAILAEEVSIEGLRVLKELEQINGDINREIKELAYDLGFQDGLLAGRREHLADVEDPDLKPPSANQAVEGFHVPGGKDNDMERTEAPPAAPAVKVGRPR